MKIASLVKFITPSSAFEVYPDGVESAAVFYGGEKRLSIGRICTGNFNESMGLAEKLRRHLANDGLLAEADSENVIPFGHEYRVRRHWKFSGNIGELTDDINADNGGKITDLSLEEVVFTFPAKEVKLLLMGEDAPRTFPGTPGVIYDGGTLPLTVKVCGVDGVDAEFYCGDDFWRHNCAAAYPGASARHTVIIEEDKVRWVRHVLTIPEEETGEKRPWRFKALFAVGKSGEKSFVPDAVWESCGCFAAPANHRKFREFIRKTTGKAALLESVSKAVCEDGAHISRPGKKVAHGMLGEIFDDYIWANGAMARKDGVFAVKCRIPELAESLIAANLGAVPEVISEAEDAFGI